MADDRELEDWIESFMEYTENSEPRPMFRKWVAVSTVAACLQRKTWLPLGQLTVFPNMYIVLVGPPAARKGTAMYPARVFLDRLGIQTAADESSRQRLVGRLKDSAETEARSTGILTHCSLTIFATELTVFLGYNNAELMTILCKWFDCESRFRYETYAHGDQIIANVWVNLLGATTPSLLRSSMPQEAAGSGLISRMVFVFEDDKDKVVILPSLSVEQQVIEPKLLQDLEWISVMSGPFTYTPGFIDVYTKWRMKQEAKPPFKGHILQAYTERRAIHALKMSMIFSASRSSGMEITQVDFTKAASLLAETEENMHKAFAGVGANPYAEVQARIKEVIATAGGIPEGALYKMFMNDLTYAQFGEVLGSLTASHWCYQDLTAHVVHFNPKGNI